MTQNLHFCKISQKMSFFPVLLGIFFSIIGLNFDVERHVEPLWKLLLSPKNIILRQFVTEYECPLIHKKPKYFLCYYALLLLPTQQKMAPSQNSWRYNEAPPLRRVSIASPVRYRVFPHPKFLFVPRPERPRSSSIKERPFVSSLTAQKAHTRLSRLLISRCRR